MIPFVQILFAVYESEQALCSVLNLLCSKQSSSRNINNAIYVFWMVFAMTEKVSIGMDKPLPPPLPDQRDYLVDFDGVDDPIHPYNWKTSTKYVRWA